ncbi:TPA: DUF1629 domain-containing protein [Escherichia coli]
MKYYFLEFQYPRKGFISGGGGFTPVLKNYYCDITDDLPINTRAEIILYSSVRKMNVDFFHTTTSFLLVSDDFKKMLSNSNIGQFIPSVVKYSDGSIVNKKYWVTHNLRKIDCLDYNLSEYAGKRMVLDSIQNPPKRIVKGLKKIVLDVSKINGAEFFLLDNCQYMPNPIISEILYEKIKKYKLKINATPVGDFKV